jgi:hypothetical protein
MQNNNQTKRKSLTNKTKPRALGAAGSRTGQTQLENLLRTTTFYNKFDEG